MIGHLWTIVPHLARGRGSEFDVGRPWETRGADLGRGRPALRGHYERGRPRPSLWGHLGEGMAVVLVHGLGGDADSVYMRTTARALRDHGFGVLRTSLRGSSAAPGEAGDVYHAALTQDLSAALASPELAPYSRIAVIGFSLGGHISLRWAMEPDDPRVVAVAAVCPPLDLAACATHLDAPAQAVYRHHVLRGLKDMFARVHEGKPLPSDPERVARIRTIRGWDAEVVVPRHGFGSVDNYYAIASAGPRLRKLAVPTLLVEATHDPMIPAATAAPHLDARIPQLTVRRTTRGGHVGFFPWLDLGFAGPRGLEGQLAAWIHAQARAQPSR